jgi:hypothetical protein
MRTHSTISPERWEPPPSRLHLWFLFWAVGVLMGLLGAEAVLSYGGETSPSPARAQPAQDVAVPTISVQVQAMLTVPTATPTPEPTATAKPSVDSGPAPETCGLRELKPGDFCLMPPPTPEPTPTLPSCFAPEASPGDLCMVREGETQLGTPTAASADLPPVAGSFPIHRPWQ